MSFAVAANTGPKRVGTLIDRGADVYGRRRTRRPARSRLRLPAKPLERPGAPGAVTVTAGGLCAWSAALSNPEWLAVTGGSPGTGNGQVTFSARGERDRGRSNRHDYDCRPAVRR